MWFDNFWVGKRLLFNVFYKSAGYILGIYFQGLFSSEMVEARQTFVVKDLKTGEEKEFAKKKYDFEEFLLRCLDGARSCNIQFGAF